MSELNLKRKPMVCLMTPNHVSVNPRMVKEADALAAAGYDVHVIAADVAPFLRKLDDSIFGHCAWNYTLVQRGPLAWYAWRTLLQRVARLFIRLSAIAPLRISTIAHHRLTAKLGQAAARIPADLYIAHNLAALPAADYAAKENNAKLGFDAEDFHTEELSEAHRNVGDQAAREVIEHCLLPKCSHLTAASPLIARAYRDKYGVQMQTILNVFPLSEAPERPRSRTRNRKPSLYWFSQTIGHGRGLEAIMHAISHTRNRPLLALRGRPAAGYADNLKVLARKLGLEAELQLLPVAPASEMASLASVHTLGLAIEPGVTFNNRIALSNKAFTYLLAGLPVILSRTPAQEELAAELGEAAILVDLDDPNVIAQTLDTFLDDPDLQERAREHAWHLGRERFNWDIEKQKFLQSIQQTLDR